MKGVLPNRPGRVLAMLGFFVVAATLGWSGERRVWVQYQAGAKGPVMAALAQSGGRVHYEFDHLGAVAVSLPEQALNGISRNPHVTLVEDDPIRWMSAETVPYGVPMVQSPLPIGDGATGSGITVGVIDSGVFATHEDFGGLTLAGEPGSSPNDPLSWNRDRDSHGTHVVGTIAAAAGNGKGVVGVAPGVDGIYMVKVFGDTGNWIYSSTLLAAVQRAVATNGGNAKIVSMSLGGGLKSKTEENGLKQIYSSGVLLVAAAGNEGNNTTSYPAGYSSVMSVAAVDINGVVAGFSQKNSTVEISAPGVGVLSTVSYKNASLNVGSGSFIASAMEGSAQATASGILAHGGVTGIGSWEGKVVLVERGNISFADKVANVQAGNGVAAIIYNNVEGGFSGTLVPFSSSIPAVSITQADGQTLVGASVGQSATVSTVAEIDVSGYDYFDGTSMATPHVSGVAALVWSAFPEATNIQIRQALVSTALDLGAPGRDNSYGYGLVQAKAAIDHLDGSQPPPTPLAITSYGAVSATKGKPGGFTVSFTTTKTSTGTIVTSPNVGSSSSSGTSFSVKFQGSTGTLYTITVSATAGTETVSQTFLHQN